MCLFHHRQPLFIAGEFASNYLCVCFSQALGCLSFLPIVKHNPVYFLDAVHFYRGAGKEVEKQSITI